MTIINPHHQEDCIKDAITKAEQICKDRNLRFTDIRRQVLELIWERHQAVKAYDLLAKLSEVNHSAKPPTVYRALDFLLENCLIHRIESMNAFMGCTEPDQREQVQLLICKQCSSVEEVVSTIVYESISDQAKDVDFTPHHQVVEVIGVCSDCKTRH